MQFDGQIALVTGGSRGIGREIVHALAGAGCDVAFTYHRDDAAAEETLRLVTAAGRRGLPLKGDVADAGQAAASVEQTVAILGGLHILVNNAGTVRDNLLAAMPPEDIVTVIHTNLLGTIYFTQAALRPMLAQRSGRIVNLSSVAARTPGKGQSNYAASKGGIEAFTAAMAVELAPRGILVNAVAPGVIRTEMSQEIRERGEDEIMGRLLVKRYGEPEEIARAVLFLASPANRYITGKVLPVDGGLKMA